jgi:hypothetical protein
MQMQMRSSGYAIPKQPGERTPVLCSPMRWVKTKTKLDCYGPPFFNEHMAEEKRSGGDRRSGSDRRSGKDRRERDAGPPPEGDRRTDETRRSDQERRSGKDRRSGS